MTLHKVSELEGGHLRRAVAMADGHRLELEEGASPDINWQQGGPIIERERIAVYFEKDGYPSPCWVAGLNLSIYRGFLGTELTAGDEPTLDLDHAQSGPSPLVAAMRAYVASKFGGAIELDD